MDGEAPAVDREPPIEAAAPRRRWHRVLGWSVLGLLAALGLLIAGLNTGPGRALVARQVSGMTFANGLRIAVGRIDGSLYGAATLREVKVYDTKGVFLDVPQIALDWRPFAYLRGHVDIRSAHAALVDLERVPAFKPSTTKGPLLPDLTIDIGRLTVDRLVAEPAVSGARRVLRIDGRAHVADRRAEVKLAAQTIGAPGGDRLDLDLDAVPEANRLALKVQLDAPAGGVIGALAGLKDGLALRLDGAGDWARWDGTLAADLGRGELARLALAARQGTVKAAGTARLQPLLNGTVARLAGTETRIDLSAALDQRRATLGGQIASDAITLAPSGVIDLGANRFAGLAVAANLLRPEALARGLTGRAVQGWVKLDGAFARPQVQYRVNAAALAINDIALEGLSASGTARVDADQIAVPVSARVARIAGLDTAAGGPLRNVALDGDLAIKGSRLLADNLRLRSDRIDAKATLVADMARGAYSGALTGRVNSYRIDSVGVLALDTSGKLEGNGKGVRLTGSLHARSQQVFNTAVRDFLGGNAAGSGDFAYDRDGIVRFSRLRLAAPLLRVFDGHGSYSPDGQIAVTATGHSTRYGPLALELTGTSRNPKAVVVAQSPGLGLGLAQLRAQIIGNDGSYHLLATGQTDYGPLTAEVTMAQGKGPTVFEIRHGDLTGIGFTGRVQSTPVGPYVGQLAANGRGLAGTVQLGATGRHQEAVFHLRANDTVLPGPAKLTIGSAIADGRVVLYDKPYVVADVQLAQTRLRGFDL
ncbi:MAG: hypothetical protein JSR28_00515, partial [Proteobacteria bacterium]|nr:hypothetical protein [Pseudomonadota bacterium]